MDCESLLRLGRLYAAHKGLTLNTVSTYVAGSGDTLARLKRGHTITLRRVERIAQAFADHWPADAPWPQDIPRPAPSAREPVGAAS